MFASITRTTFRSPAVARSYASQPAKGVFAAMKDKVLGAAEEADSQTGASDKAQAVKQSAKETAEGVKQTANSQLSAAQQAATPVKDALAGAAQTASNLAGKVVPDLESQQPSQADVPPELRSDPYAGEKLDKKLKAEGKDLPTTGNQAGYSGNLATANPLVSGTSGGGLDGGSSR